MAVHLIVCLEQLYHLSGFGEPSQFYTIHHVRLSAVLIAIGSPVFLPLLINGEAET